jgi:hypothetical protein
MRHGRLSLLDVSESDNRTLQKLARDVSHIGESQGVREFLCAAGTKNREQCFCQRDTDFPLRPPLGEKGMERLQLSSRSDVRATCIVLAAGSFYVAVNNMSCAGAMRGNWCSSLMRRAHVGRRRGNGHCATCVGRQLTNRGGSGPSDAFVAPRNDKGMAAGRGGTLIACEGQRRMKQMTGNGGMGACVRHEVGLYAARS